MIYISTYTRALTVENFFLYQEAEAQLAKYNLTAQRVDGYDGASMASAELQHLLNTGVVSVEHDALVMDGSRSVLVSEFFFLRKKSSHFSDFVY